MDPQPFISVTIKGMTPEGSLTPRDIDINETKELISDAETLLFPTKSEKTIRPKISYEVQEGSVRNIFYIPAAQAIMFSALATEVMKRSSVELLNPAAAQVIDKWQRRAIESGRTYEIRSSESGTRPVLSIDSKSTFIIAQTDWVNTSTYLYGEIYEEGGLSRSNLHINTERFGRLTVSATRDQLTSGDNKLYNVYGLWVKGKQNISTGELKDLTLIDFLDHKPNFEKLALEKLIDRATAKWRKIKDKNSWLSELRGGTVE